MFLDRGRILLPAIEKQQQQQKPHRSDLGVTQNCV